MYGPLYGTFCWSRSLNIHYNYTKECSAGLGENMYFNILSFRDAREQSDALLGGVTSPCRSMYCVFLHTPVFSCTSI